MKCQRCPHCRRLMRPLAGPGRPPALERHRVARPCGGPRGDPGREYRERKYPVCPGSGLIVGKRKGVARAP